MSALGLSLRPELAGNSGSALAITLYDHVAEVAQIIAVLEAIEDEETLPEYRERLEGELVRSIASTRDKIDRTSAALGAMESAEAAAQMELDRLLTRKQRIEKQRLRLEGYVLMVLAARNLAKLDGYTSTLGCRKNPESVFIESDAELAPEFLRYPKAPAAEPNKTAIKAAIQGGFEVPGCRLERKLRLVRS